MTRTCPTCDGEGVIKSEETIAIEAARTLRMLVDEAGGSGPEAYLVRLNPRVTQWFTGDGARELHALESETGHWFHFEGSEGLPLEHLVVTQTGTREEIAERAVPFRAGEEVHVDIVEPHMYDPDAAVAKVDGYLITVANGLAFVGEKKLVRIEEAGRTSASAVLTGADLEAAEAAATERAAGREQADQRARRSAAAKKGAAKRKAREEAERSEEAQAVATLSNDSVVGEAGTGPGARDDAAEDESEPKPKRSRRGGRSRRRKSGAENGASADTAGEADAPEAPEEPESPEGGEDDALSSAPRRRGRRGGRRRSRAKAQADAEVTD
jgi:ribonuclease G